jgi:hypothetical protein
MREHLPGLKADAAVEEMPPTLVQRKRVKLNPDNFSSGSGFISETSDTILV